LNVIGLPNDGGEYHAIKPETKIGISSASKYKDGAWSFVRSFLTEDHQESCELLPIHKGAFSAVMQAAIDGKSAWTSFYENGKVTAADVKMTESLISGASYAVSDSQTLEEVVLEEALGYFSGDKTAQEAAEKIQSRASLYVNEQM
jgi:ABC-type glycerol-3-phosphate transport system substrate-binding protein